MITAKIIHHGLHSSALTARPWRQCYKISVLLYFRKTYIFSHISVLFLCNKTPYFRKTNNFPYFHIFLHISVFYFTETYGSVFCFTEIRKNVRNIEIRSFITLTPGGAIPQLVGQQRDPHTPAMYFTCFRSNNFKLLPVK